MLEDSVYSTPRYYGSLRITDGQIVTPGSPNNCVGVSSSKCLYIIDNGTSSYVDTYGGCKEKCLDIRVGNVFGSMIIKNSIDYRFWWYNIDLYNNDDNERYLEAIKFLLKQKYCFNSVGIDLGSAGTQCVITTTIYPVDDILRANLNLKRICDFYGDFDIASYGENTCGECVDDDYGQKTRYKPILGTPNYINVSFLNTNRNKNCIGFTNDKPCVYVVECLENCPDVGNYQKMYVGSTGDCASRCRQHFDPHTNTGKLTKELKQSTNANAKLSFNAYFTSDLNIFEYVSLELLLQIKGCFGLNKENGATGSFCNNPPTMTIDIEVYFYLTNHINTQTNFWNLQNDIVGCMFGQ